MTTTDVIVRTQDALRSINSIEESKKETGLVLIDEILAEQDPKIVEFGYHQLILNQLLKLTKFESPTLLRRTIDVLLNHYGPDSRHQDAIMESILYRYGLSSDYETCRECVISLSSLMDMMDQNVCKHSKQIMQAADLNNLVSLNDYFIELLRKMQLKLPMRKT